MKTRSLVFIVLSVFLSLMAFVAYSQPKKRATPVDPGNAQDPRIKFQVQDVPPNDPTGNVDGVPITGLEYLLIGGGLFGIYKKVRSRFAKS